MNIQYLFSVLVFLIVLERSNLDCYTTIVISSSQIIFISLIVVEIRLAGQVVTNQLRCCRNRILPARFRLTIFNSAFAVIFTIYFISFNRLCILVSRCHNCSVLFIFVRFMLLFIQSVLSSLSADNIICRCDM